MKGFNVFFVFLFFIVVFSSVALGGWEFYRTIPDSTISEVDFEGAVPTYIDIDSEGNLWVVCYMDKKLYKVTDPLGDFNIVQISTPSWVTGSGPSGIVCGSDGYVYVTYDDAGQSTQGIYKYSLNGEEVGMYTLEFRPGPIDMDGSGRLFVGEKTGKKLVIISSLDPLTYTESDTVTDHLFRGLQVNESGDTVYTYGDSYALERWVGDPSDASTYSKVTLDKLSFVSWAVGKGLYFDGKYLYGAVTNHDVVYIYNKDGFITDVVGVLEEGEIHATGFGAPGDVTVSSDGSYMFVTDQLNQRVIAYRWSDDVVSNWWRYYGSIPDTSVAVGNFGGGAPAYIDLDPNGDLWVVCYMDKKLYKVTDPLGDFNIVQISTPSWVTGSGPSGIVCGSDGYVYVTYDDAGQSTQGIYKYSLNGEEVGMYTLEFRPGPIDMDGSGRLFVGEKTGKKLVIISSLDPLTYTESDTVTDHLFRGLQVNESGDTVYTYGDSYALERWVGDPSDASTYSKVTLDKLSFVSWAVGKGLYFDGKYLYGAVTDHEVVYVYDKNGLIADVVGKFDMVVSDTTGFNHPGGIALTPDGKYMFVTDQGNDRILIFEKSEVYVGIDKPSSLAFSDPLSFRLFQNYPNPFNMGTNISFSVRTSSPVRVQVKIFNLLGQEVRTLLDESVNSGKYVVYWDGKDNQGKTVNSGVYFCKMLVDNQYDVRRMILLK